MNSDKLEYLQDWRFTGDSKDDLVKDLEVLLGLGNDFPSSCQEEIKKHVINDKIDVEKDKIDLIEILLTTNTDYQRCHLLKKIEADIEAYIISLMANRTK